MKPRTLGVSMAARSHGLSGARRRPIPSPWRAASGGFTATLVLDEAGITRASAGMSRQARAHRAGARGEWGLAHRRHRPAPGPPCCRCLPDRARRSQTACRPRSAAAAPGPPRPCAAQIAAIVDRTRGSRRRRRWSVAAGRRPRQHGGDRDRLRPRRRQRHDALGGDPLGRAQAGQRHGRCTRLLGSVWPLWAPAFALLVLSLPVPNRRASRLRLGCLRLLGDLLLAGGDHAGRRARLPATRRTAHCRWRSTSASASA